MAQFSLTSEVKVAIGSELEERVTHPEPGQFSACLECGQVLRLADAIQLSVVAAVRENGPSAGYTHRACGPSRLLSLADYLDRLSRHQGDVLWSWVLWESHSPSVILLLEPKVDLVLYTPDLTSRRSVWHEHCLSLGFQRLSGRLHEASNDARPDWTIATDGRDCLLLVTGMHIGADRARVNEFFRAWEHGIASEELFGITLHPITME
jgi:hypothetical protein